jgi:RNA polymerase sigma-70 factor, ECF subfamily
MNSRPDPLTAHRSTLFGIAYRMLGSVADAEDIVQETFLRWRKQDATAIDVPKAWLIATATRLCIDQLRSARRRREEYVGIWLPEPLVQETAPAANEHAALADSLSMAFMLMLENLAPVDRAVFLLREAFDYEYTEISRIVDKSEAACRQIISRAKAQLTDRAEPIEPPPERAAQIMQRFLTATHTGELPDLLALLTDNVVLYSDGGGRVAAALRPIQRADRVARFFIGIRRFAENAETSLEFVQVNGRPGALLRNGGHLDRVISVDFAGDRICAIYIVRNPEKLRHIAPRESPR